MGLVRAAPAVICATSRVKQSSGIATAARAAVSSLVGRIPAQRASPATRRSMASVAVNHGHSESLQSVVHKQSLEDPVGFWGQAALDIKWFKFPTKIFSGEGDGASEVRIWVNLG
jgi:hypothetical protein